VTENLFHLLFWSLQTTCIDRNPFSFIILVTPDPLH
jgi:hypothetical protein